MKQISKHPWLREHWLLLNRGNDWLDPNDYYNLYRFSDLLEYFYSSNNESVDQGWMKNEENPVPHLTLLNDTKLDNLVFKLQLIGCCSRRNVPRRIKTSMNSFRIVTAIKKNRIYEKEMQ
ncbi:hypothetical protein QR98_0060460 [Sarcoptes scabiei]|uniref:Uncharacterized protein n=1 Tax=Sarcoptes scabiei TaxID=52283 RepID=A0A132A9K1_SARSC|nr:hypothetical protein QR98_0060460 [Sarcoptes scabiei]